MKSRIQALRTGIWHLRRGGLPQFAEWTRRRRADLASSGQRDGTVALPLLTYSPTGTDKTNPAPLFNPMQMPRYSANDAASRPSEVRVAAIMDDFSLEAWSYEFDVLQLPRNEWREVVDQGIDLLLVESAWAGNHGEWRGLISDQTGPSDELVDLVTYCQSRSIPTVFWNKEDPPHFLDFLPAASLFDVVFTTDADKIDEYKTTLNHERVYTLPFAAQPAIHNPIRMVDIHQEGDVAFAGMYFRDKYPERREQMEMLLGAAIAVSRRMEHGLTIYSRHADGDGRYQFPRNYRRFVAGSLDYRRMLSAYRAFKVFLNVNSVVASPSMCARRVFEISASGTPVVSTPSSALERFFPADEVPTVSTQEQAKLMMSALVQSAELRDRIVHKAQRRIWRHHTYAHRAARILEVAGIQQWHKAPSPAQVTAAISTNRPHQVDHVLSQLASQRDVDLEVLLLTHGFSVDIAEISAKAKNLGIHNLRVLHQDRSVPLGDCLNTLVDAASGEYFAKIDDDDLYGPHYLLDQTNAVNFTGADVVGKQAAFTYLKTRNVLVLRSPSREHRWTTQVAGATLVGRRSTFQEIGFPAQSRGEDTTLLRRLSEEGGRIYSADRFNFVAVRGSDDHTWHIDDLQVLASGKVCTYGLNTDHVFL